MSENQIDLFPRLQSSTSPDSQRLNLLALARVRGIGEASLKAFLKKFTDLQGVWDTSPEELHRISTEAGLRLPEVVFKDVLANRAKLEEGAKHELASLARQGIQFLTDLDDAFPQRLRDIDDPPRWLFVQGDVKLLSAPNLIAVV
jgi:DNA processing protein